MYEVDSSNLAESICCSTWDYPSYLNSHPNLFVIAYIWVIITESEIFIKRVWKLAMSGR